MIESQNHILLFYFIFGLYYKLVYICNIFINDKQ
jgi:hypothetical protein